MAPVSNYFSVIFPSSSLKEMVRWEKYILFSAASAVFAGFSCLDFVILSTEFTNYGKRSWVLNQIFFVDHLNTNRIRQIITATSEVFYKEAHGLAGWAVSATFFLLRGAAPIHLARTPEILV